MMDRDLVSQYPSHLTPCLGKLSHIVHPPLVILRGNDVQRPKEETGFVTYSPMASLNTPSTYSPEFTQHLDVDSQGQRSRCDMSIFCGMWPWK